MTLDRTTRKQLIEARARIKAQLIDLDATVRGGDTRAISAELQDELRQIDDLLGKDPDEFEPEPGDEDPDAQAAAAAAERDYEPATGANNYANALASKVVVDDAAGWNLSHIALVAAALALGIAGAIALVK
jgi:hypothetical protein